MNKGTYEDICLIKEAIKKSFDLYSIDDAHERMLANDIVSFKFEKSLNEKIDDMINDFKKINAIQKYNQMHFREVKKDLQSSRGLMIISIYYIDKSGDKFRNTSESLSSSHHDGGDQQTHFISQILMTLVGWVQSIFMTLIGGMLSIVKGSSNDKKHASRSDVSNGKKSKTYGMIIIVSTISIIILFITFIVPCYFSQIPGSCISNFRMNLLGFMRNVRKSH